MTNFIKKVGAICQVVVVIAVTFFALAPCAVREYVAQSAGVEWNSALKKAKTTLTSGNSCFNLPVLTTSENRPGLSSLSFTGSDPDHTSISSSIFRADFSGASIRRQILAADRSLVPQYILFKRMKMAVA